MSSGQRAGRISVRSSRADAASRRASPGRRAPGPIRPPTRCSIRWSRVGPRPGIHRPGQGVAGLRPSTMWSGTARTGSSRKPPVMWPAAATTVGSGGKRGPVEAGQSDSPRRAAPTSASPRVHHQPRDRRPDRDDAQAATGTTAGGSGSVASVGAGIDCGKGDCTERYAYGTPVTLAAAPRPARASMAGPVATTPVGFELRGWTPWSPSGSCPSSFGGAAAP